MSGKGALKRAAFPDGASDQGLCTLGVFGDLWTSEEKKHRRRAIRICQQCPVLQDCYQQAVDRRERFFVSGGVYWGKRSKGKSNRDSHGGVEAS